MQRSFWQLSTADMDKALREYSAAEQLMPDNLEMKFWKAVSLANNVDIITASGILREIYEDENYGENWCELLRRLPPVGLLAVTEMDFEVLHNSQ